MVLHTVPSFSVYNDLAARGYNEAAVQEQGMSSENMMNSEFSFCSGDQKSVGVLEGIEESSSVFDGAIESASPLYLAMGLGVEMCELQPPVALDEAYCGSDQVEGFSDLGTSMEDQCTSPSILDPQKLLSQSEEELKGAEAQDFEGEALSHYAKLIWERDQDRERALSFFQKAVQAAPTDSNVLAAYASFLWEAEEEGDEGGQLHGFVNEPVYNMEMASTSNGS